MVTSVNDLLIDEAIRHQIGLSQYSNDVVRRMIAMLNEVEPAFMAHVSDALTRLPPDSFTIQRLQSMLGSSTALMSEAMGQIGNELGAELLKFAMYETEYQANFLDSFSPVSVHVASVNAAQVYQAVTAEPMQGALLSTWLANVGDQTATRVQRAIARGFVENLTIDQMVQRVRGTRAAGYTDGILEQPRRETQAIVRTSIADMANGVNDAVLGANKDIISAIQWVSTIDLRTTPFCQVRDGLLYKNNATHTPIGHPFPWMAGPGRAHWNCRSFSVPVLKSMGNQTVLVNGTRASMDGQVPESTTYVDWLKNQSAARQDAVLGPTRGQLLRRGKLPLEDMYSRDGQYKTLAELRDEDAAAFRRAGL